MNNKLAYSIGAFWLLGLTIIPTLSEKGKKQPIRTLHSTTFEVADSLGVIDTIFVNHQMGIIGYKGYKVIVMKVE